MKAITPTTTTNPPTKKYRALLLLVVELSAIMLLLDAVSGLAMRANERHHTNNERAVYRIGKYSDREHWPCAREPTAAARGSVLSFPRHLDDYRRQAGLPRSTWLGEVSAPGPAATGGPLAAPCR